MALRIILRRRPLIVAGTALVAVIGLAAIPAFALTRNDGGAAKTTTTTMSMKGMAGMKGMDHSAPTMQVVSGALTGSSPCELSGPPASVGQVAKDAEGHNQRGPLVQFPLTQAERELLIQQQRQARAVVDRYPTVASAEAAGYRKSTPYVPCIGAHYTNVSLVAKFDPNAPSELLFDGTTPDAKIVGLSYLVVHPGGAPEGFAGPNDMWHQHSANGGLCLNPQGVVIGNEATSATDCAARGGKKAALTDIWMLHDWVVPGWECGWGVFAGECPELGGRVGGTVFDPPNPAALRKVTSTTSTKK